jgi:hypothetical protein
MFEKTHLDLITCQKTRNLMQDNYWDVATTLLLPHYVNSCSLLLWCIIIHVSFHFRVILFSLPLCLIKALDSNLGI